MITGVFNTIVSISILSSLAILFALAIRFAVLRNISRKLCYLVCLIIFLNLIIPFNVSYEYSIYNYINKIKIDRDNPGIVNYVNGSTDLEQKEKIVEISENEIDYDDSIQEFGTPDINLYDYISKTKYSKKNHWSFYLSISWMLITLTLIIYFSVIYIYEKSKMEKSILSKVSENHKNIYIAKNILSPVTIGIIQPKIYIPECILNEEKHLVHVIRHEKTHIRRLDHIMKPIALLIACIHWFNPLIWGVLFLFNKDMEDSCDEIVFKKYTESQRREYARTLFFLALRNRNFKLKAGLYFSVSNVKSRIHKSINYRKANYLGFIVSIILILGLIMMFMSSPIIANDYDVKNFVDLTINKNSDKILSKMIADGIEIKKIENEMEKYGIYLSDKIDNNSGNKPTSIEADIFLSSPTIWHDYVEDEWIVVGGGYWRNEKWKSYITLREQLFGNNHITIGGTDAIGIVFGDVPENVKNSGIVRVSSFLYVTDDYRWHDFSNTNPMPGPSTSATIIGFQPSIDKNSSSLTFSDNLWRYRGQKFSICVRFNSSFSEYKGTAKTIYVHTWDNTNIRSHRIGTNYIKSSKYENDIKVENYVGISLSDVYGHFVSSEIQELK